MKKYEIWMAKVRFEYSTQVKIRPIMIWDDAVYVMAYKMTGTDRGDDSREFRIEHWQESGLSKPTSIRISHILKMKQSDFVNKIGTLDDRDRLRFEMRLASWQ